MSSENSVSGTPMLIPLSQLGTLAFGTADISGSLITAGFCMALFLLIDLLLELFRIKKRTYLLKTALFLYFTIFFLIHQTIDLGGMNLSFFLILSIRVLISLFPVLFFGFSFFLDIRHSNAKLRAETLSKCMRKNGVGLAVLCLAYIFATFSAYCFIWFFSFFGRTQKEASGFLLQMEENSSSFACPYPPLFLYLLCFFVGTFAFLVPLYKLSLTKAGKTSLKEKECQNESSSS